MPSKKQSYTGKPIITGFKKISMAIANINVKYQCQCQISIKMVMPRNQFKI